MLKSSYYQSNIKGYLRHVLVMLPKKKNEGKYRPTIKKNNCVQLMVSLAWLSKFWPLGTFDEFMGVENTKIKLLVWYDVRNLGQAWVESYWLFFIHSDYVDPLPIWRNTGLNKHRCQQERETKLAPNWWTIF